MEERTDRQPHCIVLVFPIQSHINPMLQFSKRLQHKGVTVTLVTAHFLEHEAVGCFVTHCGWNSTLEALSLGVPMVAVPQWTDQCTNAKYIAPDFWKMGVKAEADEKGILRREAMKNCIKEVLETERGKEMKRNAIKWKDLAIKAFEDGGSSHKNIEEFVKHLVRSPNPKIEEQKIKQFLLILRLKLQ